MDGIDLITIPTTAFVVGLSGAMSPGPLTLVTMVRAARDGVRAGMKVCLGHGLVEVLLVLVLGMGAGAVLAQPRLAGVIAAVGSLVLGIMGFFLIRDARLGEFDQQVIPTGEERGDMGPVAAGVLATVGNPYWVMWWATVGLSYVLWANRFGSIGLALFFGGHYLADVMTMGTVSVMMVQGRRWLSGEWYRRLLLVFGFFLCGMAMYFLYSAWHFWHQI